MEQKGEVMIADNLEFSALGLRAQCHEKQATNPDLPTAQREWHSALAKEYREQQGDLIAQEFYPHATVLTDGTGPVDWEKICSEDRANLLRGVRSALLIYLALIGLGCIFGGLLCWIRSLIA